MAVSTAVRASTTALRLGKPAVEDEAWSAGTLTAFFRAWVKSPPGGRVASRPRFRPGIVKHLRVTFGRAPNFEQLVRTRISDQLVGVQFRQFPKNLVGSATKHLDDVGIKSFPGSRNDHFDSPLPAKRRLIGTP